MLQLLARWSYRHRRSVVALWIVALVGMTAIGGRVGDAFSDSSSFPGTESQRAADLLEDRFPARAGDEGQIVFADASGVRNLDDEQRMEQLFADVASIPGVTAVESPYGAAGAEQFSQDGTVAYATVQFADRQFLIEPETTDPIKEFAAEAAGDGLQVELGGQMFQAEPELGSSELIGIIAAMIILLVVFGSVLAMGLPIVTALFGIGIGLAAVQLISHTLTTPDFTTQLTAMIGIGVGIDYALFIVTRYRQGLHDGLEPQTAVVRAIDTAGRAVVFAGTTVVISILGLFLMGVELLHGLAVGTSITVGLVMLASITLLPAILGFAGRTIDRFSLPGRRTREADTRTSFWFRWSRVVQRRPWPAFVGGLAVLLVLAIPLLAIRVGFTDAGGNPTSDTTRRAYDLVADGFGPGVNGPLVLAAELPPGTDASALSGLVDDLRATPGVAAVGDPTPNPAGDTAVIRVIPTTNPQSERTTGLVHDLRANVIPDALGESDVAVHVGGVTAAGIDISDRLSSRLPYFIGAVLALSFLLLMAVFRSVLVPLKAVVMNLLSIGAAYGVIVAVFQWGWLGDLIGLSKAGPIQPVIPMMVFAIVFGLSMDYEVFLLSRVREEYDRTGDNALAVADGLAATARVITAAGLIMVTVFGSFVFGDSMAIKVFGLGLAVAILIDATIVRMVLVPATMELLGDRNWWFPRWLDRIVPRLHVEPAADDLDAEAAALVDAERTSVG